MSDWMKCPHSEALSKVVVFLGFLPPFQRDDANFFFSPGWSYCMLWFTRVILFVHFCQPGSLASLQAYIAFCKELFLFDLFKSMKFNPSFSSLSDIMDSVTSRPAWKCVLRSVWACFNAFSLYLHICFPLQKVHSFLVNWEAFVYCICSLS